MDYQQLGGKALLPYFSSPVAYQRGRGFGSVLRSIFRGIIPLMRKPIVRQGLKRLGQATTTALIEAGQRALDDSNVTFGSALKNASKSQAQALLNEARSQLVGQGKQRSRRKKKRLTSTKRVSKKQSSVSRKTKVKKVGRVRSRARDIFTT